MALASILSHEVDLFVGFSWRDWTATIVPSCLFALGTLKELSYDAAIRNYLVVVLWIVLYIYAFDLFTQIMSPEEDRVNKPDRPIPSGKVSLEAASNRCIVTWLAFFAMSVFHSQIIPETVIHALFTIFLGASKAGGHWMGKNVVAMSIGSWVLLSSFRKLMVPQTPQTSRHLIVISIWVGLVAQAQDFRDQEGDRKTARTTLPIAFGDSTARYILALLLTPVAFLCAYLSDLGKNAPWLLGAMHAVIAYRIIMFRSTMADHKTYMLVTYTYSAMVAISSFESLGISSPTSPIEKCLVSWFTTVALKKFD